MNQPSFDFSLQKVAFVGAFLPRRCFTSAAATRLCNAFMAEYGNCECLTLPISETRYQYAYPSRARFEIIQSDAQAYKAAADFINLHEVDVVCIQYDPEIFPEKDGALLRGELLSGSRPHNENDPLQAEGDPLQEGDLLLAFMQAVQCPVAIIFHHPLGGGERQQRRVKRWASQASAVILDQAGAGLAFQRAYDIPGEKVWEISFPDQAGEDEAGWRRLSRDLMGCLEKGWLAFALQQSQLHAEPAASLETSIPVTGGPLPAVGIPPASGRLSESEPLTGSGTLPRLKLDHYLRMNDETGMLKASVLNLPDYHQGYATADNARALIFSLLLEQDGQGPFIPIEMQASRHLAFLWNTFNPAYQRFRSRLSYRRDWLDEQGTEDTHGLALWALGSVLSRSVHPGMQGVARRLFEAALPAVKEFSDPVAWAYSLLGIQEYLGRFSGDRAVTRAGKLLLGWLASRFRENRFSETAASGWPWLEESIMEGSARIPQAMIASARWSGDHRAAEVGLKMLEGLAGLQFSEDGMFVPGIHTPGKPSRFLQRSAEAGAMISACLEAFRYSGDRRWLQYARSAFQWFLGRNILGRSLYDPQTGGCCDGLAPGRADANYSAEALLAFLIAQIEMRLSDQMDHQRLAAHLRLPILQIGPSNPLIPPQEPR